MEGYNKKAHIEAGFEEWVKKNGCGIRLLSVSHPFI